jgi:cytochrome c peroxidase
MNSILLVLAIVAAAPVQSGPNNIPPTGAEVELGRELFFDPLLSQDGNVACATCHDPSFGWADGRPLAVGIAGQVGTRHSPTIINASYSPLMFWDGRTVGQDTQALLPLSNPIEMGRQTEADVLGKLRLTPRYVQAFARIYGVDPTTGSPITGPRLARAIAAFETTVVSFNAPIDRYLDGDENALTADQKIGYGIMQRAGCFNCHTPPLFTDNLFHNNGFEYASRTPGQRMDEGRAAILRARNLRPAAGDVRAFKTPTLREIHRTAPYGHNGGFATLDRVLLHYQTGGMRFDDTYDRSIDPRVLAIRFLYLSETELGYVRHTLETAFAGSPSP